MGSTGAKRAGGLMNNVPPERETVTDDYGRTYPVVSREDVPEGYKLWTSGTWRGASDDYNNGYAVFARITDYHVDTDTGVVVRVSGEEADIIRRYLDGGHATSAVVERYIKRYEGKSTSAGTRRRVERFKRGLEVLKRLRV